MDRTSSLVKDLSTLDEIACSACRLSDRAKDLDDPIIQEIPGALQTLIKDTEKVLKKHFDIKIKLIDGKIYIENGTTPNNP